MLDEFITYLKEQVGEPYIWSGQHTKLTPENYKSVIAKKESSAENRKRVEAYCEKQFAKGKTTLYGYDCSGLGCFFLFNLHHLYSSDVTADTMMRRSKLVSTDPKRGYWVFKCSGNKATHIGDMISDTKLIEAQGRDVGVVETTFKKSKWSCWGIPKVFEDEIVDPPTPTEQYVLVIGGSVNVRTSDSTKGRILTTVHKGDKLPYLGTAPTGWYNVRTNKGDGYISNKKNLTRLEK